MDSDTIINNSNPPPPPSIQITPTLVERAVTKLDQPYIVGYMSVDVHREYHRDLSQLKYLNSIPRGRLHYDLNHNIDKAVKRTTDDNGEKITLLLKFIIDRKDYLKDFIKEGTFICYRRTLISVMCNFYTFAPVTIVGSLFNNCIYLCSIESPQDIIERNSYRGRDKFCAWGYKFEQYMLSDMPHSKPDICRPVLENEEFSMYYSAKLGNHRLLYGAQIDGMLVTKDTDVDNMPKPDDVEHNLQFLRQNYFVELKTNREMRNDYQRIIYKKYKLLRCWCQCYLADLAGLVVGYRNNDGIIKKVQYMNTGNLVKNGQHLWTPNAVINFLDGFLNFVNTSFESKKAASGDSYDPTKPLTLKFNINERHKYSFTETNDEADVILPDWYIKNFQKKE